MGARQIQTYALWDINKVFVPPSLQKAVGQTAYKVNFAQPRLPSACKKNSLFSSNFSAMDFKKQNVCLFVS